MSLSQGALGKKICKYIHIILINNGAGRKSAGRKSVGRKSAGRKSQVKNKDKKDD